MRFNTIKKTVFLFFLLINLIVKSQNEKGYNISADKSFENARNLAFNKQRKQAKDTLKFILKKYPNYLDARSFLGSIYSWEGEYENARKELLKVLEIDKNRKNDWVAVIKNEFYAKLPYRASLLIEKALQFFSDDVDILLLKAEAEEKTNKTEEVILTLNKILTLDPENIKVINYKNNFTNSLRVNSLGVKYSTIFYYKNERETSHYGRVSYARKTKYGSVNGKVNYSRRFGKNSFQYELDLYPRIMDGLYGFVNVGFSNDDFFPSIKYGAELYKAIPKSFEVSLGFRGLKLSETTIIYTGSVSWYFNNNYLSFRTYITPNNFGSSKTGILTYRNYFSDADNYLGITLGIGVSPELERLPVNQNQNVTFDLQSQQINTIYSFTSINKKYLWRASLNLLREEKSFLRGNYFLIYELGISCDIRFK